MTIETIPEHMLTNDGEAAIAGLLARCFRTDFGGRSFFQTRHSWRHIIREGSITAHLAVQLRAVRLGDDLLTIAGIADVATDPGHRGKGYATALLKAAIATAHQSPASHVLLFGTAKLYPATGFRPIANPLTYLDLTGSRTGCLCHTEKAEHLQVLEIGSHRWIGTKPLDLLGGLF